MTYGTSKAVSDGSTREARSNPIVGEAREAQLKTISVNVTVTGVTDNDEAEYVLTVNGRIVKRMTRHQAQRMGFFYGNID
jgi:hypothetical protein